MCCRQQPMCPAVEIWITTAYYTCCSAADVEAGPRLVERPVGLTTKVCLPVGRPNATQAAQPELQIVSGWSKRAHVISLTARVRLIQRPVGPADITTTPSHHPHLSIGILASCQTLNVRCTVRLRRWLQLRFHFASIAIRPLIDSHSTATRRSSLRPWAYLCQCEHSTGTKTAKFRALAHPKAHLEVFQPCINH